MIGAVRMLRLARLFTFIKGVQQLRVIVSGLFMGLNSVLYIVVLLFLVIYIFSIMVKNGFMVKNGWAGRYMLVYIEVYRNELRDNHVD
jgi:hypothetical protein